jgi:integrase
VRISPINGRENYPLLRLRLCGRCLKKRFLPWCEARRLVRLDAVRTPQLKDFRCTWECSARTARRRHERMRSFFAFCVSNGWLLANPTDGIKKPIAPRTVPTDYFNRREFDRILAATREYEYCGLDCHDRADRLRTLVLLMRWSGLAIKDAVTLNRSRLDAEGALFLRRAKTGTPVYVPLPPALVSALRQLPSSNPSYFFWSGAGYPCNAISSYQRSLRKLFRIAALRDPMAVPSPAAPICSATPSRWSCCWRVFPSTRFRPCSGVAA